MSAVFLLPASTVLDEHPQRVAGWKAVHATRLQAAELADLAPRLGDLGVSLIVSSDLDEQSAKVLARKLAIPSEIWYSLRRFNWGKLHGQAAYKARRVWDQMQKVWKENPDAPVPGGDSQTTYLRRMKSSRNKLGRLKHTKVLVLARPQEIRAITGLSGVFQLGHLYEWSQSVETSGAAAPVECPAAKPSN